LDTAGRSIIDGPLSIFLIMPRIARPGKFHVLNIHDDSFYIESLPPGE